jgi:hypothetical protein
MRTEILERLIKQHGTLNVMHDPGGSGMGYYWTASFSHNHPSCSSATSEGAVDALIKWHLEKEAEDLKRKLNATMEQMGQI